MNSYYQPQLDVFNLPLTLLVFLTTAHFQGAEIGAEAKPEFYTPSAIATNYSGEYYEDVNFLNDELVELHILKSFADRLIAESVPPPDKAVALLNKNFWEFI